MKKIQEIKEAKQTLEKDIRILVETFKSEYGDCKIHGNIGITYIDELKSKS